MATPTQQTTTECILPDDDAPPIPQYKPDGEEISSTSNINKDEDGDNIPSVKNPTFTNSSQADIMYAEVGIRSAAKT